LSGDGHGPCGISMTVPNEHISAEQVRRFLRTAHYPYTSIEPMQPPYPDVRVTTKHGIIAIETTDIHWGTTTKGSPIRRDEEAAIRAGQIRSFWPQPDPTPGVLASIEKKCTKTYELADDVDEVWLLLCGGSTAAPASTFVFTPFLNLARLNSNDALSGATFSRCYLFCELTERGPAIYRWDRDTGWQRNL
jgi:hypothetical protein